MKINIYILMAIIAANLFHFTTQTVTTQGISSTELNTAISDIDENLKKDLTEPAISEKVQNAIKRLGETAFGEYSKEKLYQEKFDKKREEDFKELVSKLDTMIRTTDLTDAMIAEKINTMLHHLELNEIYAKQANDLRDKISKFGPILEKTKELTRTDPSSLTAIQKIARARSDKILLELAKNNESTLKMIESAGDKTVVADDIIAELNNRCIAFESYIATTAANKFETIYGLFRLNDDFYEQMEFLVANRLAVSPYVEKLNDPTAITAFLDHLRVADRDTYKFSNNNKIFEEQCKRTKASIEEIIPTIENPKFNFKGKTLDYERIMDEYIKAAKAEKGADADAAVKEIITVINAFSFQIVSQMIPTIKNFLDIENPRTQEILKAKLNDDIKGLKTINSASTAALIGARNAVSIAIRQLFNRSLNLFNKTYLEFNYSKLRGFITIATQLHNLTNHFIAGELANNLHLASASDAPDIEEDSAEVKIKYDLIKKIEAEFDKK